MNCLRIAFLFTASGTALLVAADLGGTWKLYPEKSKVQTEYASDIIRFEQIGPVSYRMIYDVVLKTGRTFDGKERAIKGARGVIEINDHPDEVTWRSRRIKGGKIIDERVAALDSTSRIQTVHRTTVNDSGQTVREVLVFEKQ